MVARRHTSSTDRATSTNYLYQEPDCRVERLPDALASTLPGGG